MYLELSNFRCWKNKIFEIPDEGLTLLNGISGKGKSSILNAIHFALYGVGTKLISFGEKKCKVKLIFKNIDITRTKCPNRLVIIINNNKDFKEYEDEVAQHIINKKFGTNFLITSYINQKTVNSFLNLGPTDKMNFLENLSLQEDNIPLIKKKTKDIIKSKKDLLQQKVGQLQILSQEFNLLEKPKEVLFPLGKYSDKNYSIKIKNEAIFHKRVLKQIKIIIDEKEKLQIEFIQEKNIIKNKIKQDKLYNDLFLKLKKSENEKDFIFYDGDDNLSELKNIFSLLKNKSLYLKSKEKYDEDFKNFESLLSSELNFLIDEKNKLEDKSKQYNEKYKNYDSLLNDFKIKNLEIFNVLNKEIKTYKNLEFYKAEIDKILFQIKTTKKTISNIKNKLEVLYCPHCETPVKIFDKTLVSINKDEITEDEIKKDIKSSTKDVNTLEKELKVLNTKLNESKSNHIRVEDLIKKINNIKIDANDNLEILKQKKEFITYQKILNDIKLLEQKILKKELSPTLKKLQSNLLLKEKELNILKIKIKNEIETDYTEEELREEINKQETEKYKEEIYIKKVRDETKELSKLKIEIDKLLTKFDTEEECDIYYNTKIKEKINELEILNKKNKEHEHTHKQILLFLEYQKNLLEYQKWEDKLNLCREEENQLKKLLALSDTFYKKILEAESIAISQTIDTINYYMNFYLEKFFIENPITVSICLYKETKKDIKPSINIEVAYKGHIIELNSLSGGEYDRVTLSIVLALNTIFGSNLLMLDESISSLDEDLTNDILEILKENLKDKLVLIVSHQINKGHFDNIIDLDN